VKRSTTVAVDVNLDDNAMAGIVYEGVRNTTGDGGKLFDGQSFWFSSTVPQRKWLMENALANGATIVPLEKQADVLIVDHARKNAPVGTHSYKYVEQSIRNGTLEDLADHVVGPTKSTDRPVGSMITAAKGSRSKYTEAEDQLLWNFIKPFELAGGATGGNEIYKQLEEAHGNGRHTYQSWRDRWLKHVKFQNRQITNSAYTAEDEDEGNEATQQIAQASPRRRVAVATTPPTPSPYGAIAGANGQALLNSSGRSRTVLGSSEDVATLNYRQALERKLGRILPSGSGSSNIRDWEQLLVPKRPEDVARTDAFQLRRQQAGLGTHIPAGDGVLGEQSLEPPQTGAEAPDNEDVPVESSQGSDEYFTDEDYKFLMDAAGHMIRAGDQDDDSWEKMEEHYPSHSSRSWREFWEGKVKPDYLKKLVQIKKEQESEGESEGLGSGTLRKTAEHPAEQGDEAPSSDEQACENIEGAMEEDEHGQIADKETHLEDGLDSLFGTPIPVSSKDSSPFTCRWVGCNADIPSMFMLLEHVSSKHKPGMKEFAGERGYTCRWRGCSKVKVDEYGHDIVLDLREPEVWANHFIKEHINAIRLRHGLGPSESEGRIVERETPSITHTTVEAEADSSGPHTHCAASISPRPQAPRQRKKLVQVDGSSEESDQEEEALDEESEEAEETEKASSSEDLADEIVSLSSNEDNDDADPDDSARRSKRLMNAPPSRLLEPTVFNYVDTAVGSSPPLLAQKAPDREINSPLNRPPSPSASKPPEPNEARKRSASKGNSQESNQSITNVQGAIELPGEDSPQQPVMLSPRKRTRELEQEPESTRQESPELPIRTSFEPQVKRRKQRHDQEEPVKIPSTPEHRTVLGELYQDGDDQGSSMLGCSPTPRPHARFASGDNSLHQTPPWRADFLAEDLELTSPLQISMFSDPDKKFASSSPAKSASTKQDELSSEPDLEFETAPETTGNLWVTAPSEEPDEEDAEEESLYETAPEPKGKARQRPDTQSLFAQSIPDINDDEGDPFALPEPDGGWPDGMDDDDGLGGPLTELTIPTSHQPERTDNADEEDDDAASIPSDVREWVDERVAEDDSIDDEILLCAIQATSGFNEKLIREVHDFIRARKRYWDPDTLPRHMKGCWTQEDDEALKKNDARERIRVLKKHGRSSVERRRAWLNVEI
jgi:hypothetical protein